MSHTAMTERSMGSEGQNMSSPQSVPSNTPRSASALMAGSWTFPATSESRLVARWRPVRLPRQQPAPATQPKRLSIYENESSGGGQRHSGSLQSAALGSAL